MKTLLNENMKVVDKEIYRVVIIYKDANRNVDTAMQGSELAAFSDRLWESFNAYNKQIMVDNVPQFICWSTADMLTYHGIKEIHYTKVVEASRLPGIITTSVFDPEVFKVGTHLTISRLDMKQGKTIISAAIVLSYKSDELRVVSVCLGGVNYILNADRYIHLKDVISGAIELEVIK
jgi:hypothetical protein